MFQKLQHLSARQMDNLTVSSAESRLTSDTYNVNQLLARIQRLGIRAPILLIGGIVMMLSMDAVLALVLIGLLPIIAVTVYFVTKTSVPLYTKQQSVLDSVVRTVQENITGIRVIKALSKTAYEKHQNQFLRPSAWLPSGFSRHATPSHRYFSQKTTHDIDFSCSVCYISFRI